MSKIKLDKVESYPFCTELAVRVSDLNYGAHLGYDSVLTLAHQARLALFEKIGVTELDLGDKRTGIVVSEVGVKYLGEGFLNDVLVFDMKAIQVGSIGFRLAHRVSNKTSGKDIARIEIGFVAFDYEKRSLGRLPEDFLDKLRSHAG